MAKYNYQIDRLYKIRFYDHCIGKSEKMTCEVVGWITQDNDDFIVLTYWQVDTTDKEIKRDNIEPITIIKSTIIRARKYS